MAQVPQLNQVNQIAVPRTLANVAHSSQSLVQPQLNPRRDSRFHLPIDIEHDPDFDTILDDFVDALEPAFLDISQGG